MVFNAAANLLKRTGEFDLMIAQSISRDCFIIKKPRKYTMHLICILIAVFSIIIRIPDFENTNFYNNDASWHVLHTLRCYEQTPASIHKFLPLVSLGEEEDKFISWGATIPDEYGNYYYTSFSPAGFAVPYLFLKLFHVPVSLMGLYVFNSILYLMCFVFTARLFSKLIPTFDRKFVWLLSAAIYLFQPEIMHGQGIVYWSQSLYQLILILQLTVLFGARTHKNFIVLMVLCVIGAYTEWTGYMANCGIMLVLFLMNKGKAKFIKAAGVAVSTLLAFVLFCVHFLSVVELDAFKSALKIRFMARNVATNTPLWKLGEGYVVSFGLLLCAVLFCLIYVLSITETRYRFFQNLKSCKWLFLVSVFALFENVIMKQHAVVYSFDRIKLVFPLMGLLLCAAETFTDIQHNASILLAAMFLCSVINLHSYKVQNNHFVYLDPSLAANQAIVKNADTKFTKDNSIMVYHSWVRGYLNTLFDRGIYENMNLNDAIEIAYSYEKQYAVEIKPNEGYDYYSLLDNEIFSIKIVNGTIYEEQVDIVVTEILDVTNKNWTHGVLNNGAILLFGDTLMTRTALIKQKPIALTLNGELQTYPIISVDSRPGGYIGITMQDQKTAQKFAYPAQFEIQY